MMWPSGLKPVNTTAGEDTARPTYFLLSEGVRPGWIMEASGYVAFIFKGEENLCILRFINGACTGKRVSFSFVIKKMKSKKLGGENDVPQIVLVIRIIQIQPGIQQMKRRISV